jgi:hypothetical protein
MLKDATLEAFMNTSRCLGALLLAVPLLTLSCTDSDKNSPVAPTAKDHGSETNRGPAPFAGLGSSTVAPLIVPNWGCPGIPPFIAPFDLSVQARDADLILEQVQGVFVDVFGITAPTVTLAHPQLAIRFGSTTIPAASSRTFPMQVPFGCGTAGTGTLTLVFVLRDQFGAPHTSSAVVAVH